MTGLASVAALSVVGVVAYRAQDQLDPVAAAVESKREADVLAKADSAKPASPPALAAAAPSTESPAEAQKFEKYTAEQDRPERKEGRAQGNELGQKVVKAPSYKAKQAPEPVMPQKEEERRLSYNNSAPDFGDAKTRANKKMAPVD